MSSSRGSRKASKTRHRAHAPAASQTLGLVVANYGRLLTVETETGELLRVTPRRQIGYVACGDQVVWERDANAQVVAVERQPRTTSLERIDNRGRVRVLASGFDQMAVIAAAPPGFDPRLIDQYLVMAAHLRVEPLLVLNKCDNWPPDDAVQAASLTTLYRALGYTVISLSAKTGAGLDPLRQAMRDRVSILVGQSGVGKSSIATALLPDREIRIGAVSGATGLGTHTTTTTILYRLPGGGALIDSPGVREFALDHLPGTAVAAGFREIDELSGQCRFHNCKHQHEPDCRVLEAVAAGRIDPGRYRHYLKFIEDAAVFAERRL